MTIFCYVSLSEKWTGDTRTMNLLQRIKRRIALTVEAILRHDVLDPTSCTYVDETKRECAEALSRARGQYGVEQVLRKYGAKLALVVVARQKMYGPNFFGDDIMHGKSLLDWATYDAYRALTKAQ
jgi:hypothetical protein